MPGRGGLSRSLALRGLGGDERLDRGQGDSRRGVGHGVAGFREEIVERIRRDGAPPSLGWLDDLGLEREARKLAHRLVIHEDDRVEGIVAYRVFEDAGHSRLAELESHRGIGTEGDGVAYRELAADRCGDPLGTWPGHHDPSRFGAQGRAPNHARGGEAGEILVTPHAEGGCLFLVGTDRQRHDAADDRCRPSHAGIAAHRSRGLLVGRDGRHLGEGADDGRGAAEEAEVLARPCAHHEVAGEALDVGPLEPRSRVPSRIAVPTVMRATLPPSQGISTVWLPDPQAEVAPNKAIAPVKQDRIWATAAWTIDMKELAAEFIRLKIPADRWTTAFVQVEFIRQEQFRDGTLGPETVVAPLVIHRLQPLPADGDNAGQRLFLEWAQRNTHEITNPSFYQVFGGDLWWAPGTPDPNVVVKQVLLPIPPVPAPVPNPRPGVRPPVMPRVTPPPRTTPAPRPTPARTTPTPPPSFTTGGGAPGFTMPPGMTPAAPMGPMGGWDPNTTGDPNMMGGGSMMMPMAPSFAGGAAAPGAPVQGYTPPPVGNFNPSQLGKVDLWIHDDTAGDGKVYHYKLRYKLRNPLAESNQIDPKLAAQFALTSPDSDWTDYITMRSDKHFFIQGGLYGGTVRFDIFKWQDGIWERQNAVVTPGDMIGTKDKLADFSTGWALVDIRVDSRSSDAKVILADAEGNIGGRERKTDSNSKLYEQLRQKAQEALDARNAAAASAAGAAAGTVPGGR